MTEDLRKLLDRPAIEAKPVTHFGDPCFRCHIAHDDVSPGPCNGTQTLCGVCGKPQVRPAHGIVRDGMWVCSFECHTGNPRPAQEEASLRSRERFKARALDEAVELRRENIRLKDDLSDRAARIAALEAESASLRERVAGLEGALRPLVVMLDELVAESGRGIDYGHEDAFRMGEWFDIHDSAQIEHARAALSKEGA